jgi:hypothetical protein
MTATSSVQPLNLQQHDYNSPMTCVVANTLHLLGLPVPPLTGIDQLIGRQPGQRVHPAGAYLYLLSRGLHLQFITNFNEVRFIHSGLSYLKEFEGNDWDATLEAYWTRERVAASQASRVEQRRQFLEYRCLWTEEVYIPNVNDILAMLESGQVVQLMLFRRGHVAMPALVYGYEGRSRYKLYIPQQQGNTLHDMNHKMLSDACCFRDGLVGISR